MTQSRKTNSLPPANMLQPVTKVVFIHKPKLHVERKNSFDEELEERNPVEKVKIKCQKSKCKLFPLAVTSIENHENVKGDNSPPTQDRNMLFPSVNLRDHPMLLKTYFRGSLDTTRSRLVLQKNFKKSSEKFLNFKAKHEQVADAKNQRGSVKNIKKMKISKEVFSDEEQINITPKRKKLDVFSHPLHLKILENRKNLLFPRLPKNDGTDQEEFPSSGNCLSGYFAKEMADKLGRKWLQTESQKELNSINGRKQMEGNESVYSNCLPQIKNLQNNSELNWFNGAMHYPYRRNLLLDWYTYDVCCPLPFKSWTSAKEKNDIEIIGTQFVTQGSERNPTVQSYIFTPPCDETQNKTLKNFDGINLVQCFDESRHKPSFFNQIYAGHDLNGKFSRNPLSHDSFLQETDTRLKMIQNFPKRAIKTKQLPPLPGHTVLAKMNLKEVTKKLSAWNYFDQQKPIQFIP